MTQFKDLQLRRVVGGGEGLPCPQSDATRLFTLYLHFVRPGEVCKVMG